LALPHARELQLDELNQKSKEIYPKMVTLSPLFFILAPSQE
jgi:hypothetical protein